MFLWDFNSNRIPSITKNPVLLGLEPGHGYRLCYKCHEKNYRFQQIIRSLHCVDNNILVLDDKLWKLRSILDKIKEKCLEHFEPEQNLSYDESMVEYFGRYECKQHIRGKPIRFGFMVWCLNTVSGYLVGFDVYQGKSLNTPSVCEELFGKSSAPLVTLLNWLPEDKSISIKVDSLSAFREIRDEATTKRLYWMSYM